MERFKPDSWWEAVLRPALLADPEGGLYLEFPAPDLRFLFVLLLVAALLASNHGRARLQPHANALVSLVLCFYFWTLASGNGRYFLAVLLAIGPILVYCAAIMPASRGFRATLLGTMFLLQVGVVATFVQPSPWAVAQVREGANLRLQESTLRNQPAVFVTIGGNSHSALVPLFHPQSRWTNLGGHHRVSESSREGKQIRVLLDSQLPKYAVFPMFPDATQEEIASTAATKTAFIQSLSQLGISLVGITCEGVTFAATLNASTSPSSVTYGDVAGFWFCPVESGGQLSDVQAEQSVPNNYIRAFARVEIACPRFFPYGGGIDTKSGEDFTRHYPGADTELIIKNGDWMFYRYYRSFAATHLGTVQDVASGRRVVPCQKLAGRYQVPWLRE